MSRTIKDMIKNNLYLLNFEVHIHVINANDRMLIPETKYKNSMFFHLEGNQDGIKHMSMISKNVQ